jgi:hypothetical protein
MMLPQRDESRGPGRAEFLGSGLDVDVPSACPASVGDLEREYLDSIRDVAQWRENAGALGLQHRVEDRATGFRERERSRMIGPMGVRPAPGTTELLEVLDRALGGGIVIDLSHRPTAAGLAPVANGGRIVVTAFETYLQHADPEPSRHSNEPLS